MTDILSPAEKNVVDTQALSKHLKGCFVALGGLLKANRDNAYWSTTGYENWNDYVEQLGIGTESHARRLIQIHDCVTSRILTEEDVYEIGISKTMLLLPLAERNNLNDEVLDIARNGTVRDLKQLLGHKVQENDSKYSVVCNRCGNTIYGAKYVRHTIEDQTGGI